MTRLLKSLMIAGLLAFAPAAASAQLSVPTMTVGDLGRATAEDRVLGRADAPVTVVEYASFVCSHCATWHANVFPALKTRFIDTGQIKLVFRDMPTAPVELAMPAAALARCALPANYFEVAAALMEGQAALRAGGDPNVWASAAAARAGRTAAEIEACMSDPSTGAMISLGVERAIGAGINGTPMFLVNGRLVADNSIEGLAAAITPLLPPAPAL